MGKKKLTVAFNEQDRRDYLLGFRKRKDARRTVAKQKIEKKLVEERKAQRAEKRKQRGPDHVFPQVVEDLLATLKEETIDLPTHSVTITQLEDMELAQEDLFLGRNHFVARPATEDTAPISADGSHPHGSHYDSSREEADARTADPKKIKSLEKMMAKLKKSNHRGGRGVVTGPGGRPGARGDFGKGSKSKRSKQ